MCVCQILVEGSDSEHIIYPYTMTYPFPTYKHSIKNHQMGWFLHCNMCLCTESIKLRNISVIGDSEVYRLTGVSWMQAEQMTDMEVRMTNTMTADFHRWHSDRSMLVTGLRQGRVVLWRHLWGPQWRFFQTSLKPAFHSCFQTIQEDLAAFLQDPCPTGDVLSRKMCRLSASQAHIRSTYIT